MNGSLSREISFILSRGKRLLVKESLIMRTITLSLLFLCAFESRSAPVSSTAQEIKRLIKQLGDSSFAKRDLASQHLLKIGRPAIAALTEALKSRDLEVSRRARALLAKLATSVEIMIVDLRFGRLDALPRLQKAGPKAKAAIPHLLRLLKTAKNKRRDQIIETLCCIDVSHPKVRKLVSAKAHVNGKYGNLLRRLYCPQDKQSYKTFCDYGKYGACAAYYTHKAIPAGYWVYVYPHWYIWGQQKK